jgi:ABC-type nickel/cobalt efflux system permease component RcnA
VSPSVAFKGWLVALSFSSGSTPASFNLADVESYMPSQADRLQRSHMKVAGSSFAVLRQGKVARTCMGAELRYGVLHMSGPWHITSVLAAPRPGS